MLFNSLTECCHCSEETDDIITLMETDVMIQSLDFKSSAVKSLIMFHFFFPPLVDSFQSLKFCGDGQWEYLHLPHLHNVV